MSTSVLSFSLVLRSLPLLQVQLPSLAMAPTSMCPLCLAITKGLMQDLEARITSLEEEQDRLICDNNKATALLNKLRDAPTLLVVLTTSPQGRVTVDIITIANVQHQAGVMIPTLGVEKHDSDVNSALVGEAEDDDRDAEYYTPRSSCSYIVTAPHLLKLTNRGAVPKLQERARAMHAYLITKGSKVPLALEGRTNIQDALVAYDSLMVPAPASSISKKEGKAKNCLQLSLPSGAKVPTLDAHSKPTVMSPIPQPAFMGSTPHTMLPTLNLEMGGAHPINLSGAPSLQSRQPSPLLIRSIAGDERPVKHHAASPQPDPMMIDDLPTIHAAASAMPPSPLQISVPSCSQSITANLMDEPYARPSPRITAALSRHPSDCSLSWQASAWSLHIASSSIEHSGSQGSHGSSMVPAISLNNLPCPQASPVVAIII
ncbi:hypothetical protein BKA93DRAFT_754394 [Sparassis latifolia]